MSEDSADERLRDVEELTFTLHLTAPLTPREKDTIIGSLWEHIHNERGVGIEGFTKIEYVVPCDGKYRVTPDDFAQVIGSAFRRRKA